MECLNCKKEVVQTPKKRPKLYCSEKCRVEFCRKKKAQESPKNGRGRPKKVVIIADSSNTLQESVRKAMEKAGIIPLVISSPDKAKASDVFDFPEGWDKMSKIERLKYLTANKK